jgi:hypothetical protein
LQTNLSLVAVCLAREDNCGVLQTGTEDNSLFAKNQAVFIAVIGIASLSLVALLLGLLFLRFRRQGTWVLAEQEVHISFFNYFPSESRELLFLFTSVRGATWLGG